MHDSIHQNESHFPGITYFIVCYVIIIVYPHLTKSKMCVIKRNIIVYIVFEIMVT